MQAPNKLVNEVQYKTLGFLPGYSRQYGTIQPVSGDTFIVSGGAATAAFCREGCWRGEGGGGHGGMRPGG